MKNRARYKNIINKSKGISKKETIGDPFDLFVKTMPTELDYYKDSNNYRLKAAWEAYGKPKDVLEAWYEGLIDVDRNKLIMPSIGYNEETDSYEYLNTGKDNDVVNKDIRVWENDTIPFVKELKNGGYIRTFNEELNCWMYKKGGETQQKKEEKQPDEPITRVPQAFKQGGQMNVIPEGALHARKNNMELAKEGEITHKGIPVVDKEGGQVAEVEKEEITFTKPVTEKLEDWYKKFYSKDISDKEKDELAIKCGKFIAKEILFNTDDRVGLIEKIKELEGL